MFLQQNKKNCFNLVFIVSDVTGCLRNNNTSHSLFSGSNLVLLLWDSNTLNKRHLITNKWGQHFSTLNVTKYQHFKQCCQQTNKTILCPQCSQINCEFGSIGAVTGWKKNITYLT